MWIGKEKIREKLKLLCKVRLFLQPLQSKLPHMTHLPLITSLYKIHGDEGLRTVLALWACLVLKIPFYTHRASRVHTNSFDNMPLVSDPGRITNTLPLSVMIILSSPIWE
jgi:hypothetical protein